MVTLQETIITEKIRMENILNDLLNNAPTDDGLRYWYDIAVGYVDNAVKWLNDNRLAKHELSEIQAVVADADYVLKVYNQWVERYRNGFSKKHNTEVLP